MNEFNLNGEQTLTNLNHGRYGDPHPQYQQEIFNTIAEGFPKNTWVEVGSVKTSQNSRTISEINLISSSYNAYMISIDLLLIVQQKGTLSSYPRVELILKSASNDVVLNENIFLCCASEKKGDYYVTHLFFKSRYDAMGEIKCYNKCYQGVSIDKGTLFTDVLDNFNVIDVKDQRVTREVLSAINQSISNAFGQNNVRINGNVNKYIKFASVKYPKTNVAYPAKSITWDFSYDNNATVLTPKKLTVTAKFYLSNANQLNVGLHYRMNYKNTQYNDIKVGYVLREDNDNFYCDIYLMNINANDFVFGKCVESFGSGLFESDKLIEPQEAEAIVVGIVEGKEYAFEEITT
jgi:hypothetical protein